MLALRYVISWSVPTVHPSSLFLEARHAYILLMDQGFLGSVGFWVVTREQWRHAISRSHLAIDGSAVDDCLIYVSRDCASFWSGRICRITFHRCKRQPECSMVDELNWDWGSWCSGSLGQTKLVDWQTVEFNSSCQDPQKAARSLWATK